MNLTLEQIDLAVKQADDFLTTNGVDTGSYTVRRARAADRPVQVRRSSSFFSVSAHAVPVTGRPCCS